MGEDTDVNSTRHGSAAQAAEADRGRYDGNKPFEQIEYDIARTRLRLSAAQGRTIFLSTHLLDMAERLCSRVGIIDHGELVAAGQLQALQQEVVPGGSLEEVFLKVTQPEDTDGGGS